MPMHNNDTRACALVRLCAEKRKENRRTGEGRIEGCETLACWRCGSEGGRGCVDILELLFAEECEPEDIGDGIRRDVT